MHIILSLLFIVIISVGSMVSVSADIWRDDFDTDNPAAWRIVGNDDVWKVEDGMLRITVDRDWAVQYELYQLTAFASPYRDFYYYKGYRW